MAAAASLREPHQTESYNVPLSQQELLNTLVNRTAELAHRTLASSYHPLQAGSAQASVSNQTLLDLVELQAHVGNIEEGLALLRQIDSPVYQAHALIFLARAQAVLGRRESAQDYLQQASALLQAIPPDVAVPAFILLAKTQARIESLEAAVASLAIVESCLVFPHSYDTKVPYNVVGARAKLLSELIAAYAEIGLPDKASAQLTKVRAFLTFTDDQILTNCPGIAIRFSSLCHQLGLSTEAPSILNLSVARANPALADDRHLTLSRCAYSCLAFAEAQIGLHDLNGARQTFKHIKLLTISFPSHHQANHTVAVLSGLAAVQMNLGDTKEAEATLKSATSFQHIVIAPRKSGLLSGIKASE